MAVATLVTFVPGTLAASPATDLSAPPTLAAGVLAPAAPAATSVTTGASRVIAVAKSHLGARYVWGAKGPRVFDCIGLVLRSFSDAGLLAKIGGWGNSSGYALYAWARRHHLTSTTHGEPGDVVVWGGGAHVGIYLGNGMAISALVSGVRIHGVHAVTNSFTAFIHTGLGGLAVASRKVAPHAKSIGLRHAGPSLAVRSGHATADRTLFTVKAGTRLTLVQAWRDAAHHLWYRVNANGHVGWVLASGTRT